MKKIAWIVTASLMFASSHVLATSAPEQGTAAQEACRGNASFYLAYMNKKDDTVSANFPNDAFYRYISISLAPYIHASELLDADVVKSQEIIRV